MKITKKTAVNNVKSHVKGIAAILVGYGVGEIMGNVMKDYKPDAKGLHKALIKLGAIALTGMVIKSVTDYVDGEIDDIFDTAEKIVIEVNDSKKEKEDDTEVTMQLYSDVEETEDDTVSDNP